VEKTRKADGDWPSRDRLEIGCSSKAGWGFDSLAFRNLNEKEKHEHKKTNCSMTIEEINLIAKIWIYVAAAIFLILIIILKIKNIYEFNSIFKEYAINFKEEGIVNEEGLKRNIVYVSEKNSFDVFKEWPLVFACIVFWPLFLLMLLSIFIFKLFLWGTIDNQKITSKILQKIEKTNPEYIKLKQKSKPIVFFLLK